MKKIRGTDQAWENRALGADEAHVVVAPRSAREALDAASGMQAISIRLPKDLIDACKHIAAVHGVGYQPLMRDVLQRFVASELKAIVAQHEQRAAQAEERLAPGRKVA
ncbi:MAG: hypothetical protein AB7S55_05305 [Thiomonas sp.]